MPKIAVFQTYLVGCDDGYTTQEIISQVDTWTEVTEQEVINLKKYIIDRNRRVYDKPLILIEQVPETSSKGKLSIASLLEEANKLGVEEEKSV